MPTSQADALAGLVVLAVFFAGLFWQEETRALREACQRLRTFAVALDALPPELDAQRLQALVLLNPGGVGLVTRCGRAWYLPSPKWILSAGALTLVSGLVALVPGGCSVVNEYAVILLGVVIAAFVGAFWPTVALRRRVCGTAVDKLRKSLDNRLDPSSIHPLPAPWKKLLEGVKQEINDIDKAHTNSG